MPFFVACSLALSTHALPAPEKHLFIHIAQVPTTYWLLLLFFLFYVCYVYYIRSPYAHIFLTIWNSSLHRISNQYDTNRIWSFFLYWVPPSSSFSTKPTKAYYKIYGIFEVFSEFYTHIGFECMHIIRKCVFGRCEVNVSFKYPSRDVAYSL